MNAYASVFRRFWWVLVLGLVAAVAAGVSVAYHVTLGFPPQLEERAERTYAASAQLLVTSAEVPYLRTAVRRDELLPSSGESVSRYATPETAVLVQAANLYPLLIESDEVAARREERFGRLPGEVTARGIYSISSLQRFEPSTVPVIEIVATGGSEPAAVKLADATLNTFRDWIADEQRLARVSQRERILVEPLRIPTTAISTGGTSLALPLLVFLTVFAASCVLAVLLSRLFPSRHGIRVKSRHFPRAVRESKTAA